LSEDKGNSNLPLSIRSNAKRKFSAIGGGKLCRYLVEHGLGFLR